MRNRMKETASSVQCRPNFAPLYFSFQLSRAPATMKHGICGRTNASASHFRAFDLEKSQQNIMAKLINDRQDRMKNARHENTQPTTSECLVKIEQGTIRAVQRRTIDVRWNYILKSLINFQFLFFSVACRWEFFFVCANIHNKPIGSLSGRAQKCCRELGKNSINDSISPVTCRAES